MVVRRATEVLGPAAGARSEEDLTQLWNVLVDEVHPPAAAPPTPPPLDDGAVEPGNAEAPPVPTADEDVDLDGLVDAPSHTDEVIERLTEAFPGAELQTKESTEEL